jgi:hypothetical protein
LDYVIKIDSELDSPALRQQLDRAVLLVLQSARDQFYAQGRIIRRGLSGYDPVAVRKSAELEQARDAQFLKDFGRPRT